MFTLLILTNAALAADSGETHWVTLDERLSNSQTHWLEDSNASWLEDSDSSWSVDGIDKSWIRYADSDFVVIEASLGCLIDGKFCAPSSVSETVFVSLGAGYLMEDKGDYYLPSPLLDGALKVDTDNVIDWEDGTYDLYIVNTHQGDLGVLTVHKTQFNDFGNGPIFNDFGNGPLW